MISPLIKVREFDVQDAVPYGVALNYENKDGEPKTDVMFAKDSPFPSKKAITLLKSEAFKVELVYQQDEAIPKVFSRTLGTYSVQLPRTDDKRKVKLIIGMNLHGLASVESAMLHEDEEYDEPVPVQKIVEPAAATVDTAAANGPAAAAAADGEAPMEAEPSVESAAGGDSAAPEDGPAPMEAEAAPAAQPAAQPAAAQPQVVMEKKKRIKKTPLTVAASQVAGRSQQQINELFEKEGQMQSADKLQEDTNEAKNTLEAYIYDLRNKLYEGLGPYVQETEREALSAQLSAMEDWLYDEGEDETKSTYVNKLEELRAKGDPIEARAADDAARPAAIEELQSIVNQYLQLADSSLPAHAHFEGSDRETLRREAGAALEWLNEKVALQAQLHKYDQPMLTTADIHKKRDVVERVCKPIASKPPPKKEQPAPAAQPAGQAASAAEAQQGAAAGGDVAAPMEEEAPAAETSMEQ
eukprot:GHRR01008489.1.p1 GENE.GHRR01008489.1~~GHRR01008489.1.p1  ORF type:complete len:469 (+),score=257.62 GHRR01008489.1:1526-2932(+)